jgi:hemerythrin-like domain-containing protein
MQARGPLMIEHRLIERMLSLVRDALLRAEKTQTIDPLFVDQAVDFIKVYADRTHHGKEEEIMFREMHDKNLAPEDRRVMNELIEEHVFGRTITKAVVEGNTRYRNGDQAALPDIMLALHTLVDFYPRHIEKEDKLFFPAARAYFSEAEDQAMLARFWEFDRQMIHEKYSLIVDSLQKQ